MIAGSGKWKMGFCLWTTQGGVVWLVTITAGEEGVEELQEEVLEEESSSIEGGGGAFRGMMGEPSLVMWFIKCCNRSSGKPQEAGTRFSHSRWHRNLHSLHLSPLKKYS